MSAFVRAHRRGVIGAVAVFILVSPFLFNSEDITGALVIALLMSALAWWLIARRSIKGEVQRRGKLPKKVRHALRKAATIIDRDTVILDLETTGKIPIATNPWKSARSGFSLGGRCRIFGESSTPGRSISIRTQRRSTAFRATWSDAKAFRYGKHGRLSSVSRKARKCWWHITPHSISPSWIARLHGMAPLASSPKPGAP